MPMRYTFPHYAPPTEIVQPDYQKWQAVQVGMTREEVVALLGPPREDNYRGPTRPDSPQWQYGYLQLPMLPHPRTYVFDVCFDDDRVWHKSDPFHGRFSSDGRPTVPEIMTPHDRTVFSHYPRIIDMRWYPSSGVYPMTYAVEIGHGSPRDEDRYYDQLRDSDLPAPFLTTSFVGAQPGRFRVQAKNELGESDWSEYRYFEFTV